MWFLFRATGIIRFCVYCSLIFAIKLTNTMWASLWNRGSICWKEQHVHNLPSQPTTVILKWLQHNPQMSVLNAVCEIYQSFNFISSHTIILLLLSHKTSYITYLGVGLSNWRESCLTGLANHTQRLSTGIYANGNWRGCRLGLNSALVSLTSIILHLDWGGQERAGMTQQAGTWLASEFLCIGCARTMSD